VSRHALEAIAVEGYTRFSKSVACRCGTPPPISMLETTRIVSRHAACVSRLNRLFYQGFGEACIVRVQDSVRLDEHSEQRRGRSTCVIPGLRAARACRESSPSGERGEQVSRGGDG